MSDDLAHRLRDLLQELLSLQEDRQDGWQVTQFVISMGIERMDSDGHVDATCWYWAPPAQPDWMIAGLLQAAMELRTDDDDLDD
jgi:hypothetical protein